MRRTCVNATFRIDMNELIIDRWEKIVKITAKYVYQAYITITFIVNLWHSYLASPAFSLQHFVVLKLYPEEMNPIDRPLTN